MVDAIVKNDSGTVSSPWPTFSEQIRRALGSFEGEGAARLRTKRRWQSIDGPEDRLNFARGKYRRSYWCTGPLEATKGSPPVLTLG